MKTFHKIITWPLVIVFLSQNITWGEPHASSQFTVHNLRPNIFIPEQYGRIEKTVNSKLHTVNPSQSQPTVVIVKDAHCNYEAQTNITKILDTLIKDYKIDLVGVEGAAGLVNPAVLLKSDPKKELVKKVADKYLHTGLLTASEVLSMNKGKEPGFTIWGVEDLKLYLKDYEAFKNTINRNNAAKHFIDVISDLLDQLKKKIYLNTALNFDNTVKKYESNKLPLTQFIETSYTRYGIPKEYKNLKLVLKSVKLEKQVDFKAVENERLLLIKELEKTLPKEDLQELVKQSLLFKLGKLAPVEYYGYLEEKLRELNKKSVIANNLLRYIKLIKLQNKIDETALFDELEKTIEVAYSKLCIDKISIDLHQFDRNINILNKILTLEATRENLAYFRENQTNFNPETILEFINIQAPLHNITLPPELNDRSFIEEAKKAIVPADEFYRLAIQRDKALVENLIQTMDKNKKDKAVLVCGGFHAEGIKKLLEDKNIDTVTITPSITKIQEDSREIYLKRIMDEKIDPEKMLQEYGMENFGPLVATAPQGIEQGLPRDILAALESRGTATLSAEQIRRLKQIYAQEKTNSLLKKWIEDMVDRYNASRKTSEGKIILETPVSNNFKVTKLLFGDAGEIEGLSRISGVNGDVIKDFFNCLNSVNSRLEIFKEILKYPIAHYALIISQEEKPSIENLISIDEDSKTITINKNLFSVVDKRITTKVLELLFQLFYWQNIKLSGNNEVNGFISRIALAAFFCNFREDDRKDILPWLEDKTQINTDSPLYALLKEMDAIVDDPGALDNYFRTTIKHIADKENELNNICRLALTQKEINPSLIINLLADIKNYFTMINLERQIREEISFHKMAEQHLTLLNIIKTLSESKYQDRSITELAFLALYNLSSLVPMHEDVLIALRDELIWWIRNAKDDFKKQAICIAFSFGILSPRIVLPTSKTRRGDIQKPILQAIRESGIIKYNEMLQELNSSFNKPVLSMPSGNSMELNLRERNVYLRYFYSELHEKLALDYRANRLPGLTDWLNNHFAKTLPDYKIVGIYAYGSFLYPLEIGGSKGSDIDICIVVDHTDPSKRKKEYSEKELQEEIRALWAQKLSNHPLTKEDITSIYAKDTGRKPEKIDVTIHHVGEFESPFSKDPHGEFWMSYANRAFSAIPIYIADDYTDFFSRRPPIENILAKSLFGLLPAGLQRFTEYNTLGEKTKRKGFAKLIKRFIEGALLLISAGALDPDDAVYIKQYLSMSEKYLGLENELDVESIQEFSEEFYEITEKLLLKANKKISILAEQGVITGANARIFTFAINNLLRAISSILYKTSDSLFYLSGSELTDMQSIVSKHMDESRRLIESKNEPKNKNDAIGTGRIKHETVNKQIRRAIHGGKAYRVWNKAEYEYIEGDREIPRQADEERYIEQCGAYMPQKYRNMLDTVDIVIIRDSNFLYFRDDNNHQSAHAGHRRRACYLGEGLYNKIKDNPRALAAALAHEMFHIAYPKQGEKAAEAIEAKIDTERSLRKTIDELAAINTKTAKLEDFFSTIFPEFYLHAHFGTGDKQQLIDTIAAKARTIDDTFAGYIERLAPLIAASAENKDARYEAVALSRNLANEYLLNLGFYLCPDSFLRGGTFYLQFRCYKASKRTYSSSLPPELNALQDNVYVLKRIDPLESLYSNKSYSYLTKQGLVPADELQDITDDVMKIRKGGRYILRDEGRYAGLADLQTELLTREEPENMASEIENSNAVGVCHLLQKNSLIPFSLKIPFSTALAIRSRYEKLSFIAKIAYGNIPFIEISRMLQYITEGIHTPLWNVDENRSANTCLYLIARRFNPDIRLEQINNWETLRPAIAWILSLDSESLQDIARGIYQDEIQLITAEIEEARWRAQTITPPEQGPEAPPRIRIRFEGEENQLGEREREIEQPRINPREPYTQNNIGTESRETTAAGPGITYEMVYRVEKRHLGEDHYFQRASEAFSRFQETADISERIRIFLETIWPVYLLALDDDARSQRLEDIVTQPAGILDQIFGRRITEIVRLSRNLSRPANRERIELIAHELRNNDFLIRNRFYLDTQVLRRTSVTGKPVSTLASIAYKIDLTRRHLADDPSWEQVPVDIHYLGERLDNLDHERPALGYTFRGDNYGVVVKEYIREMVDRDIFPFLYLRNPFGRGRFHEINSTCREVASKDGLPAGTDRERKAVYEIFYYSTEMHELDHKIIQISRRLDFLRGAQRRIYEEASAYLASIINGRAPFSELLCILDLNLRTSNPIYASAGHLIFLRLAERLNIPLTMQDLANRNLDAINNVLRALVSLNSNELRRLAAETREDILNSRIRITVPAAQLARIIVETTPEISLLREFWKMLIISWKGFAQYLSFVGAVIRITVVFLYRLFDLLISGLFHALRPVFVLSSWFLIFIAVSYIPDIIDKAQISETAGITDAETAGEDETTAEQGIITPPILKEYIEYKATKGDSWSSIAEKYFGDYRNWRFLWFENGSPVNPDLLLEGTRVYIPKFDPIPSTQNPAYGFVGHTILPGDTLSKIAQKYYGNGNKWQKILEDNPQLDPLRLQPGQNINIRFTITSQGHTLKAPGSAGLDEDIGAKNYIEGIVNNPNNISETVQKDGAIIHVLKNEGELKDQLGIPRFYGAISPQDLVYAYGRNINGELHIYVTEAFWKILSTPSDSRGKTPMLAFIIDHEYQENILGNTHAETSRRAWNPEFSDEHGINVFYKFFIDRLVEENEIDILIKFLQEPHPNDPRGIFENYVLEVLTMKTPRRLQEQMNIAIEEDNINVRRAKIQALKETLQKLHNVIKDPMTENGMASSLVYEKLENIIYDILRKGNTDAEVNLMCISLPMALLNPLGYDVANKVKVKFYEKIEDYMRKKPHTQDDRGVRFAYDELSGQYYGFSQARLFVIGLNEDDFSKAIQLFRDVLTDPEIGIQNPENFPIYAGHTLVTLRNNPEIISNFNEAKTAPSEKRTKKAKTAYAAAASDIRDMVVRAMKEVTGRAEAAEKSTAAKEKLIQKNILGETDSRRWLAEENRTTISVRNAIAQGRYKTIPENEYGTGRIPRLGHAIDHIDWLLSKINENEQNKTKLRETFSTYLRYLNQYTLRAFQDKRYRIAYKKGYMDIVVMAWLDGTLADYTKWLKENGMQALADEWKIPLKITKMGDEIWLYFEVDGKIQQIFVELDKFNAFNEQYPADVRDSLYHQILDLIFNAYFQLQDEGNFTTKRFAERILKAIETAPIRIPDDEFYRRGYSPEIKPLEIDWYDKDGNKKTYKIKSGIIKDKSGKDIRITSRQQTSFGKLLFQYTEKAKGARLPSCIMTKQGKEPRRVVVYERRIFTSDGKKDVTDELMRNGWEPSPYLGTIKATVTIDLHSLTRLNPYTSSKKNTWQKRNSTAKVLDASEITALQIIQTLTSNGINLSDPDKEDLKNALQDTLIKANDGKTEVDFMQLWELLTAKTGIQPEIFFEIAADISGPINELLDYTAQSEGTRILNALLKEILEKLPAAEKDEIVKDEKLTNEDKLLEAFKKAAAAKGIDPNCAQNVFDLLNMGIETLKTGTTVDFNKIDSNYFELIDQIAYITNMDSSTVRRAIFGRDIPRSTGGEIKPDSILVPVIQKLKFYRELSDREKRGNLALDLDVPSILFNLDTQRGEVNNTEGNEDIQYLSALDAADSDLKKLNRSLEDFMPAQENQPAFISIPAKMFITYMRMDESQKRIEMKHNPGLRAFLDLMERAKTANIKIGLRTSETERELLEKIIVLSGLKNVVVQNDITNTREALGLRENICDTYNIPAVNVVFITPDGFTADENDIKQGLKIFGAANGSALHALLLFGVFYALTDNVVENGKISDAVLQALKAMGVDEEQINEIKQGGLFFTIKLIRIADTLKEFQNRKITIDTAA